MIGFLQRLYECVNIRRGLIACELSIEVPQPREWMTYDGGPSSLTTRMCILGRVRGYIPRDVLMFQ